MEGFIAYNFPKPGIVNEHDKYNLNGFIMNSMRLERVLKKHRSELFLPSILVNLPPQSCLLGYYQLNGYPSTTKAFVSELYQLG